MTTTSYNIKIYWIRHGLSCSNIVGTIIGNTDIMHGTLLPRSKFASDAQLSDYGVKQINETTARNKDLLDRIDLILSSELRRAIETSLILFKDKSVKIYPVPYINEHRFFILRLLNADTDNNSMGISELEKYLKANYPDSANKVDFSLLKELKKGATETFPDDINKFFSIVIPALIRRHPELFHKDGQGTNIAIVSHQLFIENYLRNLDTKLPPVNNADIFAESLTITLNDKGQLVNKKQNGVDVCDNNITCKISEGLMEPVLDKTAFSRCNDNLKERLKDVKTFIPKKSNHISDTWYNKYLVEKLAYLQLKNIDDGNSTDPKVKKHLLLMHQLNFEAFNKRDWSYVYNILDKDITCIFSNGMNIRGQEQCIGMIMKHITKWAPDTLVTSHRIKFGSGDWTCTNLIIEGSFTMPMLMPGSENKTIQPTGKRFIMNNCVICRWSEDKITEMYLFGNSKEVMDQLMEVKHSGGVIQQQIRDDGNGDEKVKKHLEVLERISFDGYNKRNWNVVRQGFDQNMVSNMDSTKAVGIEANMKLMQSSLEWSPDSKVIAHRIQFGSGDWTCVNLIVGGSFTRNMTASDDSIIAPTRKKYVMSHCSLDRWKNNKTIEAYVFIDTTDFMRQLGINKM